MKTEISLILAPCHWAVQLAPSLQGSETRSKSILKASRRKALRCPGGRSQTEACWEYCFSWVLSTQPEYSFVQIKDGREETKIKVSGGWRSSTDFFFFFWKNKQGFLNSSLSIKSVFRRTGKQQLLPTESAAISKESWEREVTHVIKTVGLQAT